MYVAIVVCLEIDSDNGRNRRLTRKRRKFTQVLDFSLCKHLAPFECQTNEIFDEFYKMEAVVRIMDTIYLMIYRAS